MLVLLNEHSEFSSNCTSMQVDAPLTMIVKITMRAVLINVNEQQKNIIDELMTVFCSAVRYSFKRLIEGQKAGDIEKDVAYKYSLNIRQSKDAVENARQILLSYYI